MEFYMKREYKLFLKDIIENFDIIELFTEDMTFEDFKSDLKTIYSVTRALEIIGEACGQVNEEIREKYSNIQWAEIRGFRDKVIHKYWGVDLEIEWSVVKDKLSELKIQINHILDNEK